LNDGGRYDPATNSWRAVTMQDAPFARFRHTAAWTGNEMVVWAGTGDSSSWLFDGGLNECPGLIFSNQYMQHFARNIN